MCMFQYYSLNVSHPLLLPLCPQSVLYICISIPAQKIHSTVPFFCIISLYITGSKFIHLSTTDSNLFLLVTSLLMKVKEESEKGGLKLNIQKNKIMTSGCITSWQIDGETMKTVIDFVFLGSQITADGDCSHVIKRHLLLERKAMTNLDSILKSRGITLPTKVCLIKAMVFPAVMYGCVSWTIKKAEHQQIDAFDLWCWRRFLRVPWTGERPNQSILKEISPEYSLEGLMLKLKPQYFGYLMWKTDSLEKTLMLGKIKGRKRRGRERIGLLNDIIDSINMSLSKLWEMVKDREAWHAAIHGVAMNWTWLSN